VLNSFIANAKALLTQTSKATLDARSMSLARNKTNFFVVNEKKYTISIILKLVVTSSIDTISNIKIEISSIRRSYNRELLTFQSPYMFVVSITLTSIRYNSF